MATPWPLNLYLRELGVLPGYLAVMFPLFAVLAYGYACFKHRKLLASWRDIREAIAPREVYARATVRFDMAIFPLLALMVVPAASYVGSLYTADRLAGRLLATHGAPTISLGAGHPIAATIAQLFASEVVGGFGAFIFHLAGHKTRLFWSLHKVHHSAEALAPFTAARGHPLDTLMGQTVSFTWRTVVVGAALYVTGGRFTEPALTVFTLLTLASLVQDAMNHAHVPLCYGWLNRIWVGPTFHHIHHSLEPQHRDKNFGGTVPVWDWLFGTMYLPKPGETFVIGLNEAEFGARNPHNTFKGYLVAPMVEFCGEFGRLVGRMGRVLTLRRADPLVRHPGRSVRSDA